MLIVIGAQRKQCKECKPKWGESNKAWTIEQYQKQSDLLGQDLFNVQPMKFSFLNKI